MNAPKHQRTSRGNATRRLSAGLLAGCLALASSGCYTTANTVTVTPLKTKYPVSASGQYVTASGDVVKEEQLEVVERFEFEKRLEAPRHEAKEARLELEPELDRLVAQHRGDAVTDLNIVATEYDSGSHGSAASWKILGWTFGITGATLVVLGAAADEDTGGDIMTVGGVFVGLGVGTYLLSLLADDPATWQLRVSGQVVRQNGK